MKKLIAAALIIATVFALAACTGKSEQSNDTVEPGPIKSGAADDGAVDEKTDAEGDGNDGVIPAVNSESDENTDNPFADVDFLEEDGRFVWTLSGAKYIYLLDGDDVVGYMTYIDYGDTETAEGVVKTYDYIKSMGSDAKIKSVSSQGSAVIIEYDESAFPCKTRAEVKEVFDSVQALSDQMND